jgi:CDP-diacylglycerol--glycerol-3-phosphate 3-phosphatidyltransferase
MISVYQLKPAFQRLLQPILRQFRLWGVTPNQLTVTALLLSAAIGSTFWLQAADRFIWLLLPIGLLLRMALNALDGMMARQFGLQSRLGAVLNELGDVLSDLFLIFPLMLVLPEARWFIGLFGVLAVLNEFAGLLGQALGGERRYDGPMGKSDRALLLGLLGLGAFFWPALLNYTAWLFGLGSGLMLLSTFIRLRHAAR